MGDCDIVSMSPGTSTSTGLDLHSTYSAREHSAVLVWRAHPEVAVCSEAGSIIVRTFST